MAKRRERLARKRPPEPRSLSVSLPSARSLGRTIGALQRELDGAIRRFNAYTARRRNPARQDASAPAPRRPSRGTPRAAAVIRRASATPAGTASATGAVRAASREAKRATRPK